MHLWWLNRFYINIFLFSLLKKARAPTIPHNSFHCIIVMIAEVRVFIAIRARILLCIHIMLCETLPVAVWARWSLVLSVCVSQQTQSSQKRFRRGELSELTTACTLSRRFKITFLLLLLCFSECFMLWVCCVVYYYLPTFAVLENLINARKWKCSVHFLFEDNHANGFGNEIII